MNNSLSLILINWLCFRLFCALIMCMIVGEYKAQTLWMECCSNRLVEITKNLPTDELKQVWIIKDIVAIVVAIWEQAQTSLPTC